MKETFEPTVGEIRLGLAILIAPWSACLVPPGDYLFTYAHEVTYIFQSALDAKIVLQRLLDLIWPPSIFIASISYVGTLIYGLPMYLFLRRIRKLNVGWFVVAGVLGGAVIGVLLWPASTLLVWTSAAGIFVAVTFRLIAGPGATQSEPVRKRRPPIADSGRKQEEALRCE